MTLLTHPVELLVRVQPSSAMPRHLTAKVFAGLWLVLGSDAYWGGQSLEGCFSTDRLASHRWSTRSRSSWGGARAPAGARPARPLRGEAGPPTALRAAADGAAGGGDPEEGELSDAAVVRNALLNRGKGSNAGALQSALGSRTSAGGNNAIDNLRDEAACRVSTSTLPPPKHTSRDCERSK
jgi:hypothetical protein